MRLLLVTETYPPEINGVALTVECLLENLIKAGHQVTLVRPKQDVEQHEDRSTHYHCELVRGVPIPRYAGLQFGLPAGRRIGRILADEQIDAVYVATEGPLGWSALRAARSRGIPAAAGFHTRFDQYLGHYGAALLNPIALAWMRRFHNRASCTLVPTSELKQWLTEHGFERVELLRRAVNAAHFHPNQRNHMLRTRLGLGENDPLVVSVGRLAPEKNLDLLVEAFNRMKQVAPKARMLWIGDGPARAALQARYPDHLFAGVLRGAALAEHFASADLFLFPSQTETFGNVTLEAMASGLSVCAFDYAAAHEHIEHGVSGMLVPMAPASAFAEMAEQMMRGWIDGDRLGVAARAAMESLSPARLAADFAQLLSTLRSDQSAVPASQENHDGTLRSTIF